MPRMISESSARNYTFEEVAAMNNAFISTSALNDLAERHPRILPEGVEFVINIKGLICRSIEEVKEVQRIFELENEIHEMFNSGKFDYFKHIEPKLNIFISLIKEFKDE